MVSIPNPIHFVKCHHLTLVPGKWFGDMHVAALVTA